MRTVHFAISDSEGVEHTYQAELFSCDENASLQLLVGQPAFEMIAGLIGTLAPVVQDGGLEVMLQGGKLGELAEHIGKIDKAAAAKLMTPLMQMVENNGGPELIAKIFGRTVRQVKVKELSGLPVAEGDGAHKDYIEQRLSSATDRDAAYGDGNMGEYWIAALMVLVVNFFPVGRDRPATWKDAVAKLTGGLLQL